MAILKSGMSGEPVRHLQQKLGLPADGIFGPKTVAALKDFQKKNGLKVDGVAGPDTFIQMGLYELVLLKKGTSGDAVKKLQEKLGLPIDGIFGPGTEKAVRDYQSKNGLTADGIAGPLTLAKLQAIPGMTAEAVSKSRVTAASVDAWRAATEKAGSGEVKTPPAAPPPPKTADAASTHNIWDTIKGIFN